MSGNSPFLPGEVLVQFDADATVEDREAVRGLVNASLKREIHTGPMKAAGVGVLDRVQLPGNMPVHAAVELFNNNPHVVVAEPNYVITTAAVSNDPGYTGGSLWGMESDDSPDVIGPAGTTNVFGSQAEEAWFSGATGSSSVYVGVIDTGFQYSHPDLNDNSWVNPGEIAGDGVDNDGNVYVDDVYGWDFYSNNNTPYDGTSDDHGTHVAGTIGGEGGNGIGVAGVNWDVTMISCKFLGANGGSTAGAIEAVDYITDLKTRHNIDIVATNNSWGGGGYSSLLEAAIIRGANQDILFIAAAGNDSVNIETTNYYPAAYSTNNPQDANNTPAAYEAVISVASITWSGALSSFSNYGATKVDLAAPGSSIYSTLPSNTYGTYSGTSMATPHVAGAAALFASQFPEGARPSGETIRDALLQTAVPTTSLDGITVTGGRLDVNAALALANPPGLDVSINATELSDQTEGDSGKKLFTFEISLDQVASSPDQIVVDYEVQYTGDATADDFDFTTYAATGSVTFSDPENPNALVQTVVIEVAGDLLVETDETFEVVIPNKPSNAGLWLDRATGTIRGDDASIEGTVWLDENTDGVFDPGESGMEGISVYVDANGNGVLDVQEVTDVTDINGNYQLDVVPGAHQVRLSLGAGREQTYPLRLSGSLEPDNFGNGSVLNDVLGPGVTLSAVGSSISNSNVFAQAENYSSTGANVFASTWNTGLWNTVDAELRVDFTTGVSNVSIDAISDDTSDYGHLRAYNGSGDLLQEYVTGSLGTGVSETMTISRATNEISYVLAAGQNGQFAWLDNLTFDSVDDGKTPAMLVVVGPETVSNRNFGFISNDVLTLEIDQASVNETDGANAAIATVTRSSGTTGDLSVTISSSDNGEASPGVSQVTIVDGTDSATFMIDAVDDLLVDGAQSVTFTVTGSGHGAGTAVLEVQDNDQPLFDWFYADAGFDGGTGNGGIAAGTITDTHLDETSEPPVPTSNELELKESEVQVGGNSKKPKMGSALEYHFSFPALDNASFFHATARRNSGDDDFRIEYSQDGGNNWTVLGTVNQATEQTIEVSGLDLSGNVLVRLIDTDRSPSNGNSSPQLDSVFIKSLYFEQAIYDLREPVTVVATADAQEHENSPVNGEFKFSRVGTTGELTVYYTVSGTAESGPDYVDFGSSVVIQDGFDSVTVNVVPEDDDIGEVPETVIVTLSESDSFGYRAAMPNSATLTILDDDLQSFTATEEISFFGISAGGVAATTAQGGAEESITEYRSGGKPANRISKMDHRWRFANVENAQSFYLHAYRENNSEGDNFQFQVTVDNDGNWEPDSGFAWENLALVDQANMQIYPVALSVSGDVVVRVIDTDPNTAGNSSQESVFVDYMYFSTAGLLPLVLESDDQPSGSPEHLDTISPGELTHHVNQAIVHWTLLEPYAEATTRLAETRFELMPLAGSTVGLAFPHENLVWIDTDAGGYGWDRVSLVETLIHEVGHLYGHDHDILGHSIAPMNGPGHHGMNGFLDDHDHQEIWGTPFFPLGPRLNNGLYALNPLDWKALVDQHSDPRVSGNDASSMHLLKGAGEMGSALESVELSNSLDFVLWDDDHDEFADEKSWMNALVGRLNGEQLVAVDVLFDHEVPENDIRKTTD